MRHSKKMALAAAALLWAPLVAAQDTLGSLLDAKATKLSVEQFKETLVQRVLVGTTPTGAQLEIIYASNGMVAGTGTLPRSAGTLGEATRIGGQWTIDGTQRICTAMVFSLERGGSSQTVTVAGALPPRCQYWYKLGDKYFLSDSDTDRSARVFVRTLKQ